MTRRGFTLTELLVTMVVMGIVGIALARLMINDSRFVAKQEAIMDARQTARAGMTLLQNELHLVSDGAVISATDTTLFLRVPYAFGVLCQYSSGATVASLMPVDSLQYGNSTVNGIAWQQANGTYTHRAGVSVAASSDVAACDADSIRVVPDGQLISIGSTFIANPGTIFYLYQRITYRFGASAYMPGRVGLYRQVAGGSDEELLVPFGSDAGFDFLVGSQLTPQDLPPAQPDSIQGVVLQLFGESQSTPQGSDGPESFQLPVRVKFVNRSM